MMYGIVTMGVSAVVSMGVWANALLHYSMCHGNSQWMFSYCVDMSTTLLPPVTPIAVMGYNILRVIPSVQVINQLHDNYNYFTNFSWLVTIPLQGFFRILVKGGRNEM